MGNNHRGAPTGSRYECLHSYPPGMRVSAYRPLWRGGPRSYSRRTERERNREVSPGKGSGDVRSQRGTKSLIRPPRRCVPAGLDVLVRVINECADPNRGQHDTARNQVPSPSDTSYARLAVRRLGGHVAGRMDTRSAVVPGYGSVRFG